MEKRRSDNLKTFVLTVFVLLLSRITDGLPWWIFVIPVLMFGTAITRKKWAVSSFIVGFAAGFLTWSGATLFFDLTINGIVMNRIGVLLSVPKFLVLVIAGIIGGLLTGLALYTGKSLVAEKPVQLTF